MHLGKEEVAIDFVTGLPQVGEFNAICVGYRPIDENNDSYQIQLMHKEQQIYTIPKSTASDPWYTVCQQLLGSPHSKAWESPCVYLVTAYHPGAGGRTGSANGVMGQYLRSFC